MARMPTDYDGLPNLLTWESAGLPCFPLNLHTAHVHMNVQPMFVECFDIRNGGISGKIPWKLTLISLHGDYSPCHNTWTIVRWACSVYRGNKLECPRPAPTRDHSAQQKIVQKWWYGLYITPVKTSLAWRVGRPGLHHTCFNYNPIININLQWSKS